MSSTFTTLNSRLLQLTAVWVDKEEEEGGGRRGGEEGGEETTDWQWKHCKLNVQHQTHMQCTHTLISSPTHTHTHTHSHLPRLLHSFCCGYIISSEWCGDRKGIERVSLCVGKLELRIVYIAFTQSHWEPYRGQGWQQIELGSCFTQVVIYQP